MPTTVPDHHIDIPKAKGQKSTAAKRREANKKGTTDPITVSGEDAREESPSYDAKMDTSMGEEDKSESVCMEILLPLLEIHRCLQVSAFNDSAPSWTCDYIQKGSQHSSST